MIAHKSGYQGPVAALVQYEKLIATDEAVDRKGATMPYTSRNGHMFSFLDPTGSMAIRLPPGDRETFIETYGTVVAEQHGRIMKDYVVVPDRLLHNTAELQRWFACSHRYVSGLTPKPTTR